MSTDLKRNIMTVLPMKEAHRLIEEMGDLGYPWAGWISLVDAKARYTQYCQEDCPGVEMAMIFRADEQYFTSYPVMKLGEMGSFIRCNSVNHFVSCIKRWVAARKIAIEQCPF